jgi:DNA-binding beta-propeller fold protein YncE
MKKTILLVFGIGFLVGNAMAQKSDYRSSFEDSTLNSGGPLTIMPYNRLIRSAGKTITFGEPSAENHSLDLCMLPGNRYLAVEHRYGIAIVDTKTDQIKAKWDFNAGGEFKGFSSTYSGISCFMDKGKLYIAWGACGSPKKGAKSAVMIAAWNGEHIEQVEGIFIDRVAPAALAIPNQIVANREDGELYLYAVLNGNNQLLKIRFEDKKIIWTVSTGVAPYGVSIMGNKAYVSNSAGALVTDTTRENAGTPWGSAYTDPRTGATAAGSLSVIGITDGQTVNEWPLGLHPTAITKSRDNRFLYITNGNSDQISVVSVQKGLVIDSIDVGLFAEHKMYYGSSPNALDIDSAGTTLYVANGLDYAIAVIKLGKSVSAHGKGKTRISGYIPTEGYPGAVILRNHRLFVANIEAKGARVLSEAKDLPASRGEYLKAYSIHKELASVSMIPLPDPATLKKYTDRVKKYNFSYRMALTNLPARKNRAAVPVPERIGEPSVFKHVFYIIKENKTYDQVYGDVAEGRGDSRLCIFGNRVTPNQHKLISEYALFDNYYVSGKSSAEGHQWADAAMISDYVQKNVAAWFRSYPHLQEDALVYNKSGFIWNNALDHGKTVRVYGEACKTKYNSKWKWLDIYNRYMNHDSLNFRNVTTIARLRPFICPTYPDCANETLSDQIRAEEFIKEFKQFEQKPGDSLPNLVILSLPSDHTAGTSPNFPTPEAMVADGDLALGRIVEVITHSRFWDSTAIFVTQDDSQSGWDHISPYRSPFLIISPYSIRHKTIHTNYNQTSAVRTIEQILGIPPMNIIDATALPMFDCFTREKQTGVYDLVPNQVPLNEMNKPLAELKGKARYYANLSATAAFKEVDGGDDDTMNKILWFNAKGDLKYPAHDKH